MTDDRALAWQCLFPADTSYAVRGGPAWFHDLLLETARGSAAHRAVIVFEASGIIDVPGDTDAIVSVNARGLSVPALHRAGFGYIRRFAVVPGLQDARWYIPLETPAVAAGAFALYAPYRIPARLKRAAVILAARSRLPAWYRDEIVIAQRARPPLEEATQQRFPGVAIHLALSSGTPGPSRKPTIGVLDARGKFMAVMKAAVSARSERLMRNEALTLARLQRDLPGRAPRLLFEGVIDGSYVTVQSPVPGGRAPAALTPMHERFLASLAGREARPASSSAMVRSLHGRHAALIDAGFTLGGLDDVLPILDELTQPPSMLHGDFAPWNLRRYRGEILAFDWEYAEPAGLPMIDAFHHLLHTGILVHGWTAAEATRRLLQLVTTASTRLSPEQMRALAIVHLVDVLLRRREEGFGADAPLSAAYRDVYMRLHVLLGEVVAA